MKVGMVNLGNLVQELLSEKLRRRLAEKSAIGRIDISQGGIGQPADNQFNLVFHQGSITLPVMANVFFCTLLSDGIR
jgi:hypothetical protein